MRATLGLLPTYRTLHRRKPWLYDSTCPLCGQQDTAFHYLLECPGHDDPADMGDGQQLRLREVRRKGHKAAERILAAAIPEGAWDTLGVGPWLHRYKDVSPQVTGAQEPFADSLGTDLITPHPEDETMARVQADPYSVPAPTPSDATYDVRYTILWKLLKWWTPPHGSTTSGTQAHAFANDVREALHHVQEHAHRQPTTACDRGTLRDKSMCWASDDTFQDIMIDIFGPRAPDTTPIIEMFSDILNTYHRFNSRAMAHCPAPFAQGGNILENGCDRRHWANAYVLGNPEYNGVKQGEQDMILQAIAHAPLARRAALIIPDVAEYRAAITRTGGSIAFQWKSQSIGFTPDDYWKGIARKRNVGKISTPMILAVWTTPTADALHPVDTEALNRRLTAWTKTHNPAKTRAPTHDRPPLALRTWEGPDLQPANTLNYMGAAIDDRHPDTLPASTALLWPRAMGAMGIFPPTYPTILESCGATPKAARRAVKAAAAALATTAHLLWRQRCTEVNREEKQNPLLTYTTRRQSRAEYTAACQQRGEPGPPSPQQPTAAQLTRKAAAVARRRGIDDPDDPPMEPEHDAMGKMTAKFCPKCDREARPQARVCPEHRCRHPLPPMRSYPRQGPHKPHKAGLRRGEADRPDRLIIDKARREHEGETYRPTPDHDYIQPDSSDTEEDGSDDNDDTESPQRPPHRGHPQRTPRTPRRTTTPTPQTRTRTRTPAVHHIARHHRAPHATDGPQFHATTTRSGLRQQQRTASCSSASGLGRVHSSGPAETHPRGDRGVPGE